MDHGDHNPPWWTRSVQDHLGPPFDIFLMLAAHPSWSDEDPNLTCPRCKIEPETFQHAILSCPARARDRDLLLKDVSSLGQDANLWTEPHLLRALGEYITNTKTGFPPDMIPEHSFSPVTLVNPPRPEVFN